jgi:hypothetical protein
MQVDCQTHADFIDANNKKIKEYLQPSRQSLQEMVRHYEIIYIFMTNLNAGDGMQILEFPIFFSCK